MKEKADIRKFAVSNFGDPVEENDIPRTARAIHEMQKAAQGLVTPRDIQFLEAQLRKGLVFFTKDVEGNIHDSAYLQSLTPNESCYRVSGLSS